jgi:hypothetical protein
MYASGKGGVEKKVLVPSLLSDDAPCMYIVCLIDVEAMSRYVE